MATGGTANRRLALAIRVIAIAAIAAGLWWFIRAMDFAQLAEDFRNAKLWPLVLAAALNFVCLGGKAVAWRVMLAPRHIVPTLRLFRLTVATFAASAIAPARAGEVLRVWSLKRQDGVPVADTLAVAVAEKLLDGTTMVIVAAPVPWLLPDLPSWVATTIAGCAAVAVALLIGLFLANRRVGRTVETPTSDAGWRGWLRKFIIGMHILHSPGRLAATVGVLLGVWLIDLGEVMAVLYAVDVHEPIAAGLLTLFTLNLTIAIPSTPAQVGALEFGAMLGLSVLHIQHEAALAFALLYHALQVIPLIAAGLIFELPLVLGRESAAEVPAPPAGADPPPPRPTADALPPPRPATDALPPAAPPGNAARPKP
jgi:uncharacterized protein (TIRG00374 family)